MSNVEIEWEARVWTDVVQVPATLAYGKISGRCLGDGILARVFPAWHDRRLRGSLQFFGCS